MLKDIINQRLEKELTKRYGERFPFDLRGEVEVIGRENGKVFYHNKGDNTVTIWAKHAMMHLLTGESFSQYGATRSGVHSVSGDSYRNSSGTLLSGKQYFDISTFPGTSGWWSRAVVGDSTTHLYPYFPVKILLGTGFEWTSWSSIGDSDYYSQYIAEGWNSATFDSNISNGSNNYSSEYSGDTLLKTRSMNDIYSTTLSTPVVLDTDFAIKGAIKNGNYTSNKGDSTNLILTSGNYFPTKAYWGVGSPSFVYSRRESRFDAAGTEVALDFDDKVENKITFTVTLPEQTGSNAGKFYPYNGFVLKVAGLYSDSKYFLKDTAPGNDAASDDTGLTEFDSYTKMSHGLIFAKRYIPPITKLHSVSITIRWTIYL